MSAGDVGIGNTNLVDKSNPKDLLGVQKVDMAAVPPVAIAHESLAFMDGERKYGFRNYRSTNVRARIYVAAAMRHISAWLEGEEFAEDSGVHHLGHARACLGILLDTQATGNLIDDRVPGAFSTVQKKLDQGIRDRQCGNTQAPSPPYIQWQTPQYTANYQGFESRKCVGRVLTKGMWESCILPYTHIGPCKA